MKTKINAEHKLTDKQYRGGFVSAGGLTLPDFMLNGATWEFTDDMTPIPIASLEGECPMKLNECKVLQKEACKIVSNLMRGSNG